ncbi:lysylphosphatidylglycerol synthase transmembrane domain-containing protein [candidate division KSB1 bacterium]
MSKKIWIGLLVSVAALYIALKDVQFGALVSTLSEIRYLYVLAGVILVIILMAVRTIRWQLLLQPVKPIRFHNLYSVYMIGHMANNILPAKLGELVRVYLVGSQEKISKSAALATMVVERLFDIGSMFAVLGFVSISFKTLDFPAWVWSGSLTIFILATVTLMILIVLTYFPPAVISFLENRLAFLPPRLHKRILRMTESFLDGLNILRRGHVLWRVAALSVVVWGMQLIVFLMGFLAFKFYLPAAALFVLVLITSLAMAVPSSPAYIGTYQVSVIFALALFDVGREAALGYSLVIHAMQALPVTALGFIYAWKSHLSLKQLSRVEIGGVDDDNIRKDNVVPFPDR